MGLSDLALNRRTFLRGMSACAATLPAQAAATPNVLIILTDDQGYGDLGCHGNDKIKTPNIDSFARESVELTQFHVSPVCAPTRSSLMTGRYNYRTGVTDTFLGRAMMYPDEVTMAEMFAAAGYRTGIFGKWHLGDNYPLRSIDQGFQESLVCTGGGLTQPSDPPGNHYQDPILVHNGKAKKFQGYCTDIFTDAALKFIERNKTAPFLTYVATNAPHAPLEVDEALVAPYRALGLDDTTAKLYAMVTNVDANVGRVLAKLRELDLERNTIVIFFTDNGPQQRRYNAGMRGLKGTVYEGGIRVPCFVRWPGQFRAGSKMDRIAAHIDLLPTLLDACGVAKKGDQKIDGKSLLPLLRDSNASWPDRTLYFQWHRGDVPELFRACAARTQQYKLVNGKELYDLSADPAEKNDIAAAHPDIVARMRRGYEEWFRDVSATRGYDPPRIQLGSPHQNPVTLTRQDWRGPRAGWDDDSLGYWEIEVARDGRYDLTLRFLPVKAAAELSLAMGDLRLDAKAAPGAAAHTFPNVRLTRGPGRLEPAIAASGKTIGVHYVEVKRL